MYLNNNYVCHFLQDYWKELVITAIKSKHNYILLCSAHEKKITDVYIHQVLSLWFMGFVVVFFEPTGRHTIQNILILNIYHLQGCILRRPRLHPCFVVSLLSSVSVQPIVSRYIHPGLVSMEWQSVDRKLRKFKMWNIDQVRSRSQSQRRPSSSVTCWQEPREETKYRNKK